MATLALPFYDDHHRSRLFRNSPYNAVLPILLTKEGSNIPLPANPRFGYLKVEPTDLFPRSPMIAFDMVLPLEAAIRVCYEQCWMLQVQLIEDWIDFIAQRIIKIAIDLALDIAFVATEGWALLIEAAIDTMVDHFNDASLNSMLENHSTVLVQRMKANCLLVRGLDYQQILKKRLFGL